MTKENRVILSAVKDLGGGAEIATSFHSMEGLAMTGEF